MSIKTCPTCNKLFGISQEFHTRVFLLINLRGLHIRGEDKLKVLASQGKGMGNLGKGRRGSLGRFFPDSA